MRRNKARNKVNINSVSLLHVAPTKQATQLKILEKIECFSRDLLEAMSIELGIDIQKIAFTGIDEYNLRQHFSYWLVVQYPTLCLLLVDSYQGKNTELMSQYN